MPSRIFSQAPGNDSMELLRNPLRNDGPMAREFDAELLLFARAQELVGKKKITITLRPGVTVEEARKVIRSTAPALETVLPHCRLAVDHEFAAADQEIRPGAVLALIPPVSGGTT